MGADHTQKQEKNKKQKTNGRVGMVKTKLKSRTETLTASQESHVKRIMSSLILTRQPTPCCVARRIKTLFIVSCSDYTLITVKIQLGEDGRIVLSCNKRYKWK